MKPLLLKSLLNFCVTYVTEAYLQGETAKKRDSESEKNDAFLGFRN